MRVPQSIRNRRIRNELAKLPMEYDFSGNKITVQETHIRLRLDLKERHVIELSLNLKSTWTANMINMKVFMPIEQYPFEPPTVKINDQGINKVRTRTMPLFHIDYLSF